MSRRRLFCAGVLVLAVLAVVALLPGPRWVVWGWLRGEHFYRGLPTSYWRGPVKEEQERMKHLRLGKLSIIHVIKPPPPPPPPPTIEQRLREWWNDRFFWPYVFPPDSGPAAVPVYMQLLSDEDAEVRNYAAFALGDCGPAAEVALPRLLQALHDDDPKVRHRAAATLGKLVPNASPELREALHDDDEQVRLQAAETLQRLFLRQHGP